MVLFFRPEGERLSIQRTPRYISKNNDTKHITDKYIQQISVGTLQSIINFGYIPLVVGGPLSIAILYGSTSHRFQTLIRHCPYYRVTVLLVWLLMMLELVAEPLYAIINFRKLNFQKLKYEVLVEIILRCVHCYGQGTWRSNLEYDGLTVCIAACVTFEYQF